jgi:hypothetical protein
MNAKPEEPWVVYRMTAPGVMAGSNAVCEQGEWEEMQRQQPGQRTLIKKGIASEAEAERLARDAPRGQART